MLDRFFSKFVTLCLFNLVLIFSIYGEGSSPNNFDKLTIWDFKTTDKTTSLVINKINTNFKDRNPYVTINIQGFMEHEYIPALRAALLAGTGPDIIWLHPGKEFSELHSYLEPLEGFLKDSSLSFRASSLDTCFTESDVLKALPLTFQGFGWYYNKDLFKKAGLDPENPPSNWADFLFACKALELHGITPIANGNNIPLTTDLLRRSLITAFFTEKEISLFYKNGWGISTSRYRTLLEMIKTLSDNEYFDKSGVFRPYFNYAINSFGSGHTGMILGLISDIGHWKNYSDSLGKDNVGYFPNISHPEMVRPGVQLLQSAGILVSINKDSKNKNLAFDYLNHLFSDESIGILTKNLGMMVPLKNVEPPINNYPILKDIYNSLDYTGSDSELFIPSVKISDIQFRLDDLLINTKEITIDEYLLFIKKKLNFY